MIHFLKQKSCLVKFTCV